VNDNNKTIERPFAVAAREGFSRIAEQVQAAAMVGVVDAETIMDFCDATVARLVDLQRRGASERDVLSAIQEALVTLESMTSGWAARLAEAA